MSSAKAIPPDAPAQIVEDSNVVRILLAGADLGLELRPLRHDTLSLAHARDLPADDNLIVRFRRASRDAKRLLQEQRIPYASDEGEIFLLDPPLAIQQSAPRQKRPMSSGGANRGHPFSSKASRVSRWLLNHPADSFNVRQLARHTKLSEGAVSIVVRELHDRMLVDVNRDPHDARVRLVGLNEPRRLLDGWVRAWELRRIRMLDWDIGGPDVHATLQRVREAASFEPELAWAVGGTAGAAEVVRAVEPADVVLWVREDQVSVWEDVLAPLPARARRGTLRLAIAPDPYLFELAREHEGLAIADPAQLYLDCATEGERAVEAAAAISRQMGW
jgi:DNA-binding MarR family transcriptional regulator